MSHIEQIMYVTPKAEQTDRLWQSLKRIEAATDSGYAYQAAYALAYVIECSHATPGNTHTAEEIAGLFEQLVCLRSKTPFQGHSVGIEVEFGAQTVDNAQVREIRLRPFYDSASAMEAIRLAHKITLLCGDASMSTLHLNFGLTEAQKLSVAEGDPFPLFGSGWVQHVAKPYRGISEKLAYISNSAARNVKLPECGGLTPPYYINGEYRADFVKEDIVAPKGHHAGPRQVARLECKGFSISRDGDVDMIGPTIDAIWKSLESPLQAERLNRGLDTIFKHASITPLRTALPADSWAEERYMHDFGMEHILPGDGDEPDENMLLGRQIAWRPAVTAYVESFNAGHPAIPRQRYPARNYLKAYASIMDTWLANHPAPEGWIGTAPSQPTSKPSHDRA